MGGCGESRELAHTHWDDNDDINQGNINSFNACPFQSHVKSLTFPAAHHREAAAAFPGLMTLRLRGCQGLDLEELEALGESSSMSVYIYM